MPALLALLRTAAVAAIAWLQVNLITQAVRVAVNVAALFAWGVFLAVVTSGLKGLGIFEILSTNPLTGLPHDMFVLFCLVFPFGFFVRLVVAYIIWCLTVQQAAWLLTSGTRILLGGK